MPWEKNKVGLLEYTFSFEANPLLTLQRTISSTRNLRNKSLQSPLAAQATYII